MIMKIYYFLFIFFISCQYSSKTEKKNLLSQKLIAQEVEFNETFDILDMAIINDYLIVMSYNSDTLIHIYSLPDMNLVSKMGLKGDSPSDMAFPLLFKGSENNAFIGGFNGGKDIKEYNITNDHVSVINTFSISTREPLNDAYIVNDSTLIYNSIFDLKLKKINLKDHSVFDICQFHQDDHQESFFYSNKGKMGINKSSIVYAYFYKDQIDFMDLDGKLINRIIGKNVTPSISMDKFDKNYISYVNLYAGTKSFYLLHRGQTHADYENNNSKDELEVYDNKGEIVEKYTFEVPPIIFAVDEKRNVLYGYSGMYKDMLLVYKMD